MFQGLVMKKQEWDSTRSYTPYSESSWNSWDSLLPSDIHIMIFTCSIALRAWCKWAEWCWWIVNWRKLGDKCSVYKYYNLFVEQFNSEHKSHPCCVFIL